MKGWTKNPTFFYGVFFIDLIFNISLNKKRSTKSVLLF